MDLEGSVVVVTGATRGIGRSAARAFAAAGSKLVLVGRSTRAEPNKVLPGSLEDAEQEMRTLGAETLAVRADLGGDDGPAAVVSATLERFGRCDVLVNNAAFMPAGTVLDAPTRRWDLAYRVNVVAALELCQGLVPGMLERQTGSVVSVSTGAVLMGRDPGLSAYGASKAALERLSDGLHTEHPGSGVAFNVLRVTEPVPTEMYKYTVDAALLATVDGRTPDNQLFTPDQIGAAICWIAAKDSSWSGNIVEFADLQALGALGARGGT